MAKRANPFLIDDENPELTAEDFAVMKPAAEAMPFKVYDALVTEQKARGVGQRGPGKKPAKVSMTIRVEPETLAAWKGSGAGWQGRARMVLTEGAPAGKTVRRRADTGKFEGETGKPAQKRRA